MIYFAEYLKSLKEYLKVNDNCLTLDEKIVDHANRKAIIDLKKSIQIDIDRAVETMKIERGL